MARESETETRVNYIYVYPISMCTLIQSDSVQYYDDYPDFFTKHWAHVRGLATLLLYDCCC